MTRPFVLIVEDDPKLSEIVRLTLEPDFKLEFCTDGQTALDRLRDLVPQIVVLDLNLPGLPGKEVLSFIRAETRLARTQVILTTADNRQAETLNNEADIVLLKPVSPAQLKELTLRLSSMQ